MKNLIKAFFAGKLTDLNPWFIVTTLLLLIVWGGGFAYSLINPNENFIVGLLIIGCGLNAIWFIGWLIYAIIDTYTLDDIKDRFIYSSVLVGLFFVWGGVAEILKWFGIDSKTAYDWPIIVGLFIVCLIVLICIVYCLYIKIKSFIDKCKVALDNHD